MKVLAFEELALFDIFDSLINVKINIYENGIECGFSFYKWDEFKGYKIEDKYIRLISKFPLIIRLIFVRDIYLRYDEELEGIIEKHLRQK